VSTLAVRVVCRPRAAEARSWTVVESAIREAMETNRMAKSSSVRSGPDLSRSVLRFSPASNFFLLSSRKNESVDLAAASRMATARTTPTSSSSFKLASSAPATSSSATCQSGGAQQTAGSVVLALPAWKEIDTERSAPIEESALAAVPPTPGTVAMPTARAPGLSNYRPLLGAFGHASGTLMLNEHRSAPQRRGKRSSGREPAPCVVYGCTVGCLLEFAQHPGLRAAHVHRRIRAKIASIAGLHARTRGSDGDLLAAGMAAVRIPSREARLSVRKSRVSTRQGSTCTLVGACVALLVAVEVISETTLPSRDVLSAAAEIASVTLTDMRPLLPGGWRLAEARAMQRLAIASRASWKLGEQLGLGMAERLVLQLRNCARAAFPDAEVTVEAHRDLIAAFRARSETVPDVPRCMLPARGGVVPLAEIGGELGGELGGGTSSASSSTFSSSEGS